MLVHEVLSRSLRDRRAVARYAGLTGSPDESGRKRREKGLARFRQWSRSARHDPIGVAVSSAPEEQRHWRSGFETTPRTLAARADPSQWPWRANF